MRRCRSGEVLPIGGGLRPAVPRLQRREGAVDEPPRAGTGHDVPAVPREAVAMLPVPFQMALIAFVERSRRRDVVGVKESGGIPCAPGGPGGEREWDQDR